MHIFAADEYPRQRHAAVCGAHERSKPYGFKPPRRLAPRGPCPTSAWPARCKRTRRFATGALQLLRRLAVPHLRRKAPQPLAASGRATPPLFRMATLLLTAADVAVELHVTNIEGRTPCDH